MLSQGHLCSSCSTIIGAYTLQHNYEHLLFFQQEQTKLWWLKKCRRSKCYLCNRKKLDDLSFKQNWSDYSLEMSETLDKDIFCHMDITWPQIKEGICFFPLSVLKLSKSQSMQLALASSSARFFWVCELDGLELVAILRLFEAFRKYIFFLI